MELTTGIEPVTSSLPRKYSTTEPREHTSRHEISKNGAGEEARTLDPQLGRLVLYQLSYTRRQRSFGNINNVISTRNLPGISFGTLMVEWDGFEPSKAYAVRFTV